jgi:signal transduction histidine kinase
MGHRNHAIPQETVMDAMPNMAIYPPPPKPRGPGSPIIPLPMLIAWALTIPVGIVGFWVAEHYWEDPVPPDTSPPDASLLGWWVVLAAGFVFVGCGIATVVRVAEARRRDRPVRLVVAVAFTIALLFVLAGLTTPLGEGDFGGALILLSAGACLALAFAITFLDGRARPALHAKTVEVAQLRASRGRLVDASDAARREIERDLHDGVQPRLVALLLNVSMARRAGQFDGAPNVIGDIEHELREILNDLRALASGILPPALTDLGLEAAVTELTALMPFRVDFNGPAERLPARAEVTAYFVIAEALTNAAKHANPTRVTVRVDVSGDRVTVQVHDDGCGGANASGGTGLLGLADRIDTLDGRLTVASPAGVGTTVTAEFSCAS